MPQNQPSTDGLDDLRHPNLPANNHSFLCDHQTFVGSMSIGQSEHAPVFPIQDMHHIQADCGKITQEILVRNQVLHQQSTGMNITNPHIYHDPSIFMQSPQYLNPVIHSGSQSHYYTTVSLPGSLHHEMVSPIHPTYDAYLFLQPKPHPSVYSSQQPNTFTSPQTLVAVRETLNTSTTFDHDASSIRTSKPGSHVSHGSNGAQHSKHMNADKGRRNNFHKNGVSANLDPTKKMDRTSSILEEFRAAKNHSSWTLYSIKGKIQ
jgi:hypothetical protein